MNVIRILRQWRSQQTLTAPTVVPVSNLILAFKHGSLNSLSPSPAPVPILTDNRAHPQLCFPCNVAHPPGVDGNFWISKSGRSS
jgi:hypothetical protein